jgi:type VI secretion system protein ImpA
MIDIQTLLSPIESHPPCGKDLSYENDFSALESAARGKTEQQFGDTLIPSEPPDWRDVEKRALALFDLTKDLRVSGLLCRAWTHLRGLEGATDGIELTAAMLEQFWENVHPQPEDGDYFMRMNALAFLDDATGFLSQLRNTDFIKSPLGSVMLRDAEAMSRGQPLSPGCALTIEQIRFGVAQASEQGDPLLLCVQRCAASVAKIATLCAEHLPVSQRPAVANIESLFSATQELTRGHDAASLSQSNDNPSDGLPSAAEGPASGGRYARLQSRLDAVNQLLEVAEFLERTEPTNPAPLLIRRAIRLMQMGFIDIMRELSPDSLGQIENITGTKFDPRS